MRTVLERLFITTQSPDWMWFENGLAYDNASLCEALSRTGATTGERAMIAPSLRRLDWLMTMQTAPTGHFRPVGSRTFGTGRVPPAPFDQQPVEAAATIAACLAAHRIELAGGL